MTILVEMLPESKIIQLTKIQMQAIQVKRFKRQTVQEE